MQGRQQQQQQQPIPKVLFDFSMEMDGAAIANQLAVLRAQKLHTERMLKTDEGKLRHLVGLHAAKRAELEQEAATLRRLHDEKWTIEQSITQQRNHLGALYV